MPADPKIVISDEFASVMQQLSAEAARAVGCADDDADTESAGSAAVLRELSAIADRLSAMEGTLKDAVTPEAMDTAEPDTGEMSVRLQRMEDHLTALRNTESVNHRLFNSLHQELKSYRDNFLRDTLQKPFIRDLVVLFDDLTSVSTQIRSAAAPGLPAVEQWAANLENSIHALLEILNRMEVSEIEPRDTVDRSIHKVVSYEPAEFQEDDGRIVMRIRRGFMWRNQLLRPEEVVAKRFE